MRGQAYDPERPEMGCARVRVGPAVGTADGLCPADLVLWAGGAVRGWLCWVGDVPVLTTTVPAPAVLRDYNGTAYVVGPGHAPGAAPGPALLYAGPLLQ